MDNKKIAKEIAEGMEEVIQVLLDKVQEIVLEEIKNIQGSLAETTDVEETDDKPEKKATESKKVKDKKKVAKKEEVKEEVEEEDSDSEGKITREYLEKLKYNDLKKFGASLNVKCVGTRDQIIDKILASQGEVEEDQEEEDNKVIPIDKKKKAKKEVAKKEEVEDSEEEEEYDNSELLEQSEAIIKENGVSEVIKVLKEVGVKVKSNKTSVVAEALAKALAEGLIDLEEDEDEESLDMDIFALYVEMLKHTVDDEGKVHEQSEPYVVNGEDVCCGHILKYSKKTKKYICEICGEEYDEE